MKENKTPLLVGVIAFVLLVGALWPTEPPQVTVVVAGRDLGAGTVLRASDLALVKMAQTQAPPDAVSDPSGLVGKTLAVVRFAGEPVTERHLGPAVDLRPDERGVAVRVEADTGLAGLLRPGMRVGLVATVPVDQGFGGTAVYAKAMLEDLRVLYVPPEFQARPYLPPQTTMTGTAGATAASGSGLTGTFSSSSSLTAARTSVREGVIMLAASTKPQEIVYEVITDTPETALTASQGVTETVIAGELPEREPPPTRWVVPVELLAALNRADASFTLVMMPEEPEPYRTAGLLVSDLVVAPREEELEP